MKTIKYLLLATILLSSGQAGAQYWQERIDSLEISLKNPPENDIDLYYIYVRLIEACGAVDQEMVMKYSRQALATARERGSTYWSADFSYMTGDAFFSLGQLDSALYYYELSSRLQQKAVEDGTEDKNENGYLELYLLKGMANIYVSRGNFDLALEQYLKALAVAERIEDPDEVVACYSQLADTYFRISNHGQAESYWLKSKQLATETGDSLRIAEANLGLMPILRARGDHSKALEYGEEAYRLFLSHPRTFPMQLMNAAMRLCEIWMIIPDYDKAMEYAQATMEYARRTGQPASLSVALYTLSTVYLKQERYGECEKYALEALAADSLNIYMNSILYSNVALSNIRMGRADKAIEYFGKALDANRAYANSSFQASLSEMEIKYETEKKEMRIEVLEEERRLIALLGISGVVMLILILILFLFLWRLNVQKKRVAVQKHQLAEQQVLQLRQEKQLIATQALLDGETQERTRLARDLHDGLGSMLTGVKLKLEALRKGDITDEEDLAHLESSLAMVSDSMLELRRVAHHLMPEALGRYGLKVALSDFCANFPSVELSYFGSDERIDPKLEIVIYRIIFELINNALKHSKASQIMVQIMQEEEYIAFIVRDNGCGFDTTRKNRGGIGLQNIVERVNFHNGRIEIDSSPGKGTEVNVELKLKR